MPSIFAVANPKGGSGKTTVAIILAGEFAKHGYSAAIVDADPQGSSYQWHASSVVRGLSPQGVDLVRAPDEAALLHAIERLGGYDCQSAFKFDPAYCLTCRCYPGGAVADDDPRSIDGPRQVAFPACSVIGAVGGSGPT